MPKRTKIFFSCPPFSFENTQNGDGGFVASMLDAVRKEGIDAEWVTGRSQLNGSNLYGDVAALSKFTENRQNNMDNKAYHDAALENDPTRKQAVANLKAYILKNTPTGVEPIFHLNIRPPQTGFLLRPSDLEDFKKEGIKITLTIHEYKLNKHSGRSNLLEYVHEYSQHADHVVFLNKKDQDNAIKDADELRTRKNRAGQGQRRLFLHSTNFPKYDLKAKSSLSAVPPTVAVTSQSLDEKLARPKNIAVFGTFRPNKGFEEAIELAKEIHRKKTTGTLQEQASLKDIKVYFVGNPANTKLTASIRAAKTRFPGTVEVVEKATDAQITDIYSQCKYAYKPDNKGFANNASGIIASLANGCVTFTKWGFDTDDRFLPARTGVAGKKDRPEGKFYKALVLTQTKRKHLHIREPNPTDVIAEIVRRESEPTQTSNRETLEKADKALVEIFNPQVVARQNIAAYKAVLGDDIELTSASVAAPLAPTPASVSTRASAPTTTATSPSSTAATAPDKELQDLNMLFDLMAGPSHHRGNNPKASVIRRVGNILEFNNSRGRAIHKCLIPYILGDKATYEGKKIFIRANGVPVRDRISKFSINLASKVCTKEIRGTFNLATTDAAANIQTITGKLLTRELEELLLSKVGDECYSRTQTLPKEVEHYSDNALNTSFKRIGFDFTATVNPGNSGVKINIGNIDKEKCKKLWNIGGANLDEIRAKLLAKAASFIRESLCTYRDQARVQQDIHIPFKRLEHNAITTVTKAGREVTAFQINASISDITHALWHERKPYAAILNLGPNGTILRMQHLGGGLDGGGGRGGAPYAWGFTAMGETQGEISVKMKRGSQDLIALNKPWMHKDSFFALWGSWDTTKGRIEDPGESNIEFVNGTAKCWTFKDLRERRVALRGAFDSIESYLSEEEDIILELLNRIFGGQNDVIIGGSNKPGDWRKDKRNLGIIAIKSTELNSPEKLKKLFGDKLETKDLGGGFIGILNIQPRQLGQALYLISNQLTPQKAAAYIEPAKSLDANNFADIEHKDVAPTIRNIEIVEASSTPALTRPAGISRSSAPSAPAAAPSAPTSITAQSLTAPSQLRTHDASLVALPSSSITIPTSTASIASSAAPAPSAPITPASLLSISSIAASVAAPSPSRSSTILPSTPVAAPSLNISTAPSIIAPSVNLVISSAAPPISIPISTHFLPSAAISHSAPATPPASIRTSRPAASLPTTPTTTPATRVEKPIVYSPVYRKYINTTSLLKNYEQIVSEKEGVESARSRAKVKLAILLQWGLSKENIFDDAFNNTKSNKIEKREIPAILAELNFSGEHIKSAQDTFQGGISISKADIAVLLYDDRNIAGYDKARADFCNLADSLNQDSAKSVVYDKYFGDTMNRIKKRKDLLPSAVDASGIERIIKDTQIRF